MALHSRPAPATRHSRRHADLREDADGEEDPVLRLRRADGDGDEGAAVGGDGDPHGRAAPRLRGPTPGECGER